MHWARPESPVWGNLLVTRPITGHAISQLDKYWTRPSSFAPSIWHGSSRTPKKLSLVGRTQFRIGLAYST